MAASRVARRNLLILGAVAPWVALLPDAEAATHPRRRYFGLQDASGTAAAVVRYGSLRLWDSGTDWAAVELAPGVYDWTRLDAAVTAATSHGIEITLVLGGHIPACYGTDPSAFAAYVTAVMARYTGRIATYEVWNEANVATFWTGTQQQMADLTRLVYDLRGQLDPTARLLGPSFAVRTHDDRRALVNYLDTGAWRYYDAHALSLYPEPGKGPEGAMGLLEAAKRRYANAGADALPVWVTEVNYGLGTDTLAAVDVQIANVLRTYLLGAAHGVARMHWYRWDWGYTHGAPLANTYLTHPRDLTPTQAGLAIGTVIRWMRGGTPRLTIADDGTHRIRIGYAGGHRLVYWNPSRTTHVRVPAGVTHFHSCRDIRKPLDSRMMRVTFRPKMVDVPT